MFMNVMYRNAPIKYVHVYFRGTTRRQKTKRYCDARIWNYIIENVDFKSAIELFEKGIQRLFLITNNT